MRFEKFSLITALAPDALVLTGLSTNYSGITFPQPALVSITASKREDSWHTSFTNPWIYTPISKLRAMGFYPSDPDEFARRSTNTVSPLAKVETEPIRLLSDNGTTGAVWLDQDPKGRCVLKNSAL